MSLKTIVQEFWSTVSGKEKTKASLESYVTDEALFQHVEMFEKGFPQ